MAAVTRYVMFRKNVSSLRVPARAGGPGGGPPRRGSARAYPRAGGGTTHPLLAGRRDQGLSPRRRGNHQAGAAPDAHAGPIPAQAGEPYQAGPPHSPRRAYPRAGGGTDEYFGHVVLVKGLSPRRRGNRSSTGRRDEAGGPIPAQAGEPRPHYPGGTRQRAYPRAGGGTPWYQVFELLAMLMSTRRTESRLPTLY